MASENEDDQTGTNRKEIHLKCYNDIREEPS